jgi:nucleoside-diphosphate-sugar epimerase
MNGRLLLTGATGFVGRTVLRRLNNAAGPALRLLLHQNSPAPSLPSNIEPVFADLSRPQSLQGICDGVDTVLHLAGYIGDDRERCDVVNGRGTEELIAQAQKAGARRFLYLSNAAVYGFAVHRDAKETDVVVDPATPISRSRVRAERAVLNQGGMVLRPLFVYGQGDRYFLPVIIRALDRFPSLINGGRARLSVISVDDLADVMIALAAEPWAERHAGAFHANDGHPVSLREIAGALAQHVGSRRPAVSVPFFVAKNMVRLSPKRIFVNGGQRSLTHRLFLVSRDHFYDSSRLWKLVPFGPGPSLSERLPQYADWYRQFVPARKGEGCA